MAPRISIVVLVVASFLFPFVFSRGKSITYDEVVHVPAGYSYLRTGEVVLNPMHPPLVKELAALPLLFREIEMPADPGGRDLRMLVTYQWRFGRMFFDRNDVKRIMEACRPPVILLSLGLAVVIAAWSYELWGPRGAVVSLLLYVFDPTITAHAQLVTTDVPLAFFGASFLFSLRRYLREPSTAWLVASGLSLGLALATKFSAVVLPPVALVLMLAHRITTAPRSRALLATGTAFAVLCMCAASVVWATYFFPSDPLFYWRGLEALQIDHHPDVDHVILGEPTTRRDPHYFLLAWLLKTPVPTIVVVGAAAALLLRGRSAGWRDEAFLLLPTLALVMAVSFLSDNLGVRYLIPCYPFLFVFAGRVALLAPSVRSWPAAALAGLIAWLVVSFAIITPDHLSYFNEIAGGARRGPEWLDDSNVDWGQGLIQLRDYVEARGLADYSLCHFGSLSPRHYGLEGKLVPWPELLQPPQGTVIASAHYVARARAVLHLQYGDGSENWIAHTKPAAIVGHAYYVYEAPRST